MATRRPARRDATAAATPSRAVSVCRMSKWLSKDFRDAFALDYAGFIAALIRPVKRRRSLDLTASVPDILAAARAAGGLQASLASGALGDASIDTAEAIISEAARFASEVL